MSRGSAGGWPVQRGIQTLKEVLFLHMQVQAAAAALAKLWGDTFLTNAGIDAGNSSSYVYRGSSNFDVILDTARPDLTGGETVTASASTVNPVANIFDNNNGTNWQTVMTGSPWVKVDFGAGDEKIITRVTMRAISADAGHAPRDFKIQGSNNDSDWADLSTQASVTWSGGQLRTYDFSNSTPYRYYRILITANGGDTDVALAEIEMMQPAAISAVISSVRALDLAAPVTEVMVFADVTENSGALTKIEVSTNDGAAWTDITAIGLEKIAAVPSGQQIKIRLTFDGDAQIESWGVAA